MLTLKSGMTAGKRKWFWVKAAVVSLILFYLGRKFAEGWSVPQASLRDINVADFIFSILILSLALALLPLASKMTAEILNRKISFSKSYQAYFYSQLGKYVPGGVWSYVGRVYLLNQQGVEKQIALLITLLEVFFLSLSGVVCFLLSAFFWKTIPHFIIGLLWVGLVIVLSLLFSPFVLRKIGSYVGGTVDLTDFRNKSKEVSLLLLVYTCFWGMVGIAFYQMIEAVIPIPFKMVLVLWGLYPLAWIVASFVFFIPAGIGVREGALVYLLNFYLPPHQSIGISLVSRIWWILAELFCSVLVLTWGLFHREKN